MSERHKTAPSPVTVWMPPAILAGIVALVAACTSTPNETLPSDPHVAGLVHVCSSCHGLEGRSVSPTFPRLAGQREDYIAAQLTAFRDRTRADPHAHTYMWGMAARLTDADIKGLAAYYASRAPVAGSSDDAALMAAGKAIFDNGIEPRDVPACQVCHGARAEGNEAIPRLAGQHPGYIREQLANFASNARANEIMHFNSQNLTPQEIDELAAYVGSL